MSEARNRTRGRDRLGNRGGGGWSPPPRSGTPEPWPATPRQASTSARGRSCATGSVDRPFISGFRHCAHCGVSAAQRGMMRIRDVAGRRTRRGGLGCTKGSFTFRQMPDHGHVEVRVVRGCDGCRRGTDWYTDANLWTKARRLPAVAQAPERDQAIGACERCKSAPDRGRGSHRCRCRFSKNKQKKNKGGATISGRSGNVAKFWCWRRCRNA